MPIVIINLIFYYYEVLSSIFRSHGANGSQLQ